MTTTLQSPWFELILHPESGLFDLNPAAVGLPGLTGCRMQIETRQYFRKQKITLNAWDITSPSEASSPHGPLIQVSARCPENDSGIQATITFALAQERPLFLWKIDLQNAGPEPVWLERIEFLRVGGQPGFGTLDFPGDPAAARWSFFSNGWQSWSHTGAYLPGQAMRISRLGRLQQPMVVNAGTPALRMNGSYTADFFGAVSDLKSGTGLFAGFLSQKQHFGTIEGVLYDRPSLALYTTDRSLLDPDASLATDWAVITPYQTSDPDPLGVYLDAVAREHGLDGTPPRPIPAGWCSWYQYYTAITAEDVRSNLEKIADGRRGVPLDLCQIDDGFQTRVGDWFSFKDTFPGGVAPLASEITRVGLTPGLWLAPFILDRRSTFYHEHPQFILRTERGNPVNAGFGWNRLTAAIDLTAPGALEESCRAAGTAVRDWGFSYLKLDFLYAAALPGRRHDPTQTREQIMRMGMQALREVVGDQTSLLGCGLPLGSGISLVDAMRVSADVNGAWEPEFHGIKAFIRDEPAMPSARNAIQNTLTRAPLHQRWWVNDPDCLLLRPDTKLTESEVQTLTTVIGLSGGSLLVSDDLACLPESRQRMAQVILPLIGKRPDVLDLLEEPTPRRLRLTLSGPHGPWTVAARFNWQETPEPWSFTPADFGLPDEPCWISTFWQPAIFSYQPGSPLSMPAIPPHGAALLSIFAAPALNIPAYLGSDLHISQGCELTGWQEESHHLDLNLDLARSAVGFIRLWLPAAPIQAVCAGKPLAWSQEAEHIYRFNLSFDQSAAVSIDF